MKNSILQSSRKFVQIRLHRDFTGEAAEIADVDVSQNSITLGGRDWLRTGCDYGASKITAEVHGHFMTIQRNPSTLLSKSSDH